MLLEFCLEYASIPHWIYLFLKYISLIILLQLSILFLLDPSTWYPDFLRQSLLSSFLCVAHVSSLTSPFPILFLTSPCLSCTIEGQIKCLSDKVKLEEFIITKQLLYEMLRDFFKKKKKACAQKGAKTRQRNFTAFKSLIPVQFWAQLQSRLISSRIIINSPSAFCLS